MGFGGFAPVEGLAGSVVESVGDGVGHFEVFLEGLCENSHPRGGLDLCPATDAPTAIPSTAMSQISSVRLLSARHRE